MFWKLLGNAVGNHLRLAREFPRYRRLYRDALPELVGQRRWDRVFAERP